VAAGHGGSLKGINLKDITFLHGLAAHRWNRSRRIERRRVFEAKIKQIRL